LGFWANPAAQQPLHRGRLRFKRPSPAFGGTERALWVSDKTDHAKIRNKTQPRIAGGLHQSPDYFSAVPEILFVLRGNMG
jgi:hypothetical protein